MAKKLKKMQMRDLEAISQERLSKILTDESTVKENDLILAIENEKAPIFGELRGDARTAKSPNFRINPLINLYPCIKIGEELLHIVSCDWKGYFLFVEKIKELYIGKDEILERIENVPDLSSHKDWIKMIEYSQNGPHYNFPDVKKISFIDLGQLR